MTHCSAGTTLPTIRASNSTFPITSTTTRGEWPPLRCKAIRCEICRSCWQKSNAASRRWRGGDLKGLTLDSFSVHPIPLTCIESSYAAVIAA